MCHAKLGKHSFPDRAARRGEDDRTPATPCERRSGAGAARPLDLRRHAAGEYDNSCTPEASRETAARIPGAELTIMAGLGHFPMSEDPERFRGYLLPVLERIAAL